MATITMASLSGEARKTGSRGHTKRVSGTAPPPFSFPAIPATAPGTPGSTEDEAAFSETAPKHGLSPPSTPPLQVVPAPEPTFWAMSEAAPTQHSFDPDFAPPDVTIISSTPPNHLSQSSPAALPSFSFGAGSGPIQRPSTSDQPPPGRRHRHKRSTAQSIDLSGIDLRQGSAVASRDDEAITPISASTEPARTPSTTPHRLTFGPSVQMESQLTPPSSRGSSVRFHNPQPLPLFRRDRMPDDDSDSALIDLDLATPDHPPSPRARKGRRAGSMHSGANRIILSQQVESHRRTESAPQLAPAFLLDPNFSRRQSMTPSTLFALGDVFEEDEEQEPRHGAPDMTNSALPSPQTTLATPRLDTANSSALSFGASSAATTSDGRSSRRKKFGRKLMFWRKFSQSETSLVSDLRNH